ncbi:MULTISPECIES: translation elongation factor Ts [Brachybacterium]|uniref:Elongation factor Ts n=1 Tax=Brachybacterium alimentarium TaxID=47845 RepID=A0A2A3YHT3_9MICO|nr:MULTISPECIES: translation elongation factor Ts [Brachybacterium]PCC34881.1 translation elongation factor Ts [Brachybacterium alimentarium]PCC38665.1 translation elongation factor Ts [Brachybacterium alimentarium]RCS62386.1 elongation factor Ts [Brachybacterium sp. JB7]RCS68958.1 elongation factor Ts [Brachybacterium alimentarium]RCS76007.1 elongation factor Ts [Brachybacterium alimentarium]
MANYTAADIKEIREITGAGMLDVKKALDEADGDKAKAVEVIRVKGLKGIAKREGRTASEGLIAVDIRDNEGSEGGQTGTLVEINSETDFVAKNDKFVALGDEAVAAAVESGASEPEELAATAFGEALTNAGATMGEKILVRRIGRVSGEAVNSYMHRTNKDLPPQVGVLVATDKAGAEVARDVAMHIAAFTPTYLTRDEVPADVVENERRIAEETATNEGKPEKAIPKIVEGRLNGFYKENVLLDQAFAKDPKQSVGKVVEAVGGTVTGFVRFRVGS